MRYETFSEHMLLPIDATIAAVAATVVVCSVCMHANHCVPCLANKNTHAHNLLVTILIYFIIVYIFPQTHWRKIEAIRKNNSAHTHTHTHTENIDRVIISPSNLVECGLSPSPQVWLSLTYWEKCSCNFSFARMLLACGASKAAVTSTTPCGSAPLCVKLNQLSSTWLFLLLLLFPTSASSSSCFHHIIICE